MWRVWSRDIKGRAGVVWRQGLGGRRWGAALLCASAVVTCSALESSAQGGPSSPEREEKSAQGVVEGERTGSALESAGYEGVIAGLRASSWSLLGAPIELSGVGLEGRVWGVTQESLGGVVVLYRCETASRASAVMMALEGESVALRLEGASLLAVILEEGELADADALLGRVMEVVEGRDVNGQDALAALLGAMVEAPTVLPAVSFGGLTRAEVLEVALSRGWMLKAAPSVARGERQVSVTYELGRARQEVSLTLVQCLDDAEAARVQRSLADLEDGVVLRRGAALVVVMGDEDSRDVLVTSLSAR